MSISSRSTKAAMYSEIERLRALVDQQEQQARADYEDLARALDKAERERDELRAQLSAPQPSAAPLAPKRSERGTRNELMKRLAITCRASVKWVDGQGFRQYKDGNWVAVPTHTIEFVSKNLEA